MIKAKKRQDGSLIVPSPIVRTPQFPGVAPGMDIEQVRQIIRNQKRSRGFAFALSIGANNSFDIQLSGTARVFLGFALSSLATEDPNLAPDQITITINNEIVIQEVLPRFFTDEFMDDEYYFFPRPLSGQDTITVQFNAIGGFTVQMIVYYI